MLHFYVKAIQSAEINLKKLLFQYGAVSERIKYLYLLYALKTEEERKTLNNKKDSGEKLVFIFAKQEKSTSSLPISKLSLLAIKKKLLRENQWKPITLEKVISFSGNNSF